MGGFGAGAVFTRASTGIWLQRQRHTGISRDRRRVSITIGDAATERVAGGYEHQPHDEKRRSYRWWMVRIQRRGGSRLTVNQANAPDGNDCRGIVFPAVGAGQTSIWFQATPRPPCLSAHSIWMRGTGANSFI
jgi:hypothetical protein